MIIDVEKDKYAFKNILDMKFAKAAKAPVNKKIRNFLEQYCFVILDIYFVRFNVKINSIKALIATISISSNT